MKKHRKRSAQWHTIINATRNYFFINFAPACTTTHYSLRIRTLHVSMKCTRTPRHEIPPDFCFFSATDTAKIVTCEKALMSELKRRLRILGEWVVANTVKVARLSCDLCGTSFRHILLAIFPAFFRFDVLPLP